MSPERAPARPVTVSMQRAMLFAVLVLAFGCGGAVSPSGSGPLVVSAGLARTHFWVGEHMDPFADGIEAETDLTFTRFYAGELVAVGGELDALETGVIDLAAPLLAPYHEGRFPRLISVSIGGVVGFPATVAVCWKPPCHNKPALAVG